ncbi:MAG: hypothetical protein ACOC7N_00680 [Chloroflexota bacterium]
MKRICTNGLVALLLVAGLLSIPSLPALSQDLNPQSMAPPLRGPDDHQPSPVQPPSVSALQLQEGDLKAVAIVGEVGGRTDAYKDDMDRAVDVMRDHGVTVDTFYYGERSFDWADVVAAATGAHFLLYMGHGVWWSGPCTQPDLVGGFYLGPEGGFIHPDQIRSDLAGRVADDAVVILSHACYSAGDSSCENAPADWPSEAEAARHVRMYAAPFVDIGLKAYFADNYTGSAASFAEHLLSVEPLSVGQIFKRVYPFKSDQFRDLSYPDAAYDLWLSGRTGAWNDAFVGIPDHVFNATPQLGALPGDITFTFFLSATTYLPSAYTLQPQNVGTDDPLQWEVTGSGGWFTVTPASGETGAASTTSTDSFAVTPKDPEAVAAASASTTGVVTVSVTNPQGTVNAVQSIEVNLRTLPGSPSQVFLPLVTHP